MFGRRISKVSEWVNEWEREKTTHRKIISKHQNGIEEVIWIKVLKMLWHENKNKNIDTNEESLN